MSEDLLSGTSRSQTRSGLTAISWDLLTRRAPDGQKIVSDGYYIPTATQQVLGNITPDWIGGLNNALSYKGFTLNVLLDFVQGNK